MPQKIFGFVGPIASGKGSAIKVLVEKGYKPYSLSDRIREEITSRGLEVTRNTLYMVSNDLREKYGSDVLAVRTADMIEKDNPALVAVDSIRNPQEIKYLKDKFGIKIIGVVADQKKRYEMFKARGINSNGITSWEEFKELDDRELAQTGEHKQQVQACLEMAEVIIENNGTLDDLRNMVEKITTQKE